VEEDVDFHCLGNSCENIEDTQIFEFRMVVSFTDASGNSLQEKTASVPPILPKLPKDIFYPFLVNSSGGAYFVFKWLIMFMLWLFH